MSKYENQAPEGVVFLNYAKSKSSIPGHDQVDTLVPKAAMDALTNGDPEPFYKIEALDFPANGSGGVYDGSFFKSFINVTKERPIPGSKRGHEWVSRGNSDFYTVGGRIDSTDNGKTGTAFLKIYIPPKGDSTENTGLIRDAKAGMVHFSLVTKPDYNVKTETDEMGNKIQVRHFTATMGAERNDAMEYGGGAMTQIVNSNGNSFDIDAAKALIEEGKIDISTNIAGDDPIHNGIVHRSVLRRLASHANETDRAVIGDLISAIDKSKNGRKTVDKDEALKLISNLIKNGGENIQDIANGLGFGDKLRNADDVKNAEIVKALNSKLGDKPIEKIDALIAENAKTAEDRVMNAVTVAFGAAEIEPVPGKGKVTNAMHVRALELCKGKTGDELKNSIELAKKDPVMIALAAQNADGQSRINTVVNGGAQSSASKGSIAALNL
jgi:hypothetical protein